VQKKRVAMHDISETMRLPSPAPHPQSIALDGDKLWMGSIDTNRIYALDAHQWTIVEEDKAPGKPWGMTVVGDELRVICGEGSDDSRIIRRFIPGHGFKEQDAVPCPGDTGSHLSYDGVRLYVSQWYNKKILGIDERGNVVRTIDLPRGVCGQCFSDGSFYVITTDDEDSDQYFLGKVDAEGTNFRDLARVPFAARGLASDGNRFWTNHRERNEIVAITI
jgi:hypothetical protein